MHSTHNTTHNTVHAANDNASRNWNRALCYAGLTVAGPMLAAAVLPVAGVVIAPLAVALPFFTMSLLEADVNGHAAA